MPIPDHLVGYMIYYKDVRSLDEAAEALYQFYKTWNPEVREEIMKFVSIMSQLDENACRHGHVTNNHIANAEIVVPKSYSLFYRQIHGWLLNAASSRTGI